MCSVWEDVKMKTNSLPGGRGGVSLFLSTDETALYQQESILPTRERPTNERVFTVLRYSNISAYVYCTVSHPACDPRTS